MTRLWPLLLVVLLAGCAGTQKRTPAHGAGTPVRPAPDTVAALPPDCSDFKPYAPAQEDPATRGDYVAGGLYKPGVSDSTPDYLPRVDCIAEPQVLALPRSAIGNRSPYTVLGRSYQVLDDHDGFIETGLASYYGNKFHGRRTSNQEVYDMYAFTAAHKSLPLPSFARVTNLENGRSVVVRVNDRGPFHEGRVVDLSYAAAVKLDIHRRGTGRVEVRALTPGDVARAQLATAAPAVPSTATPVAGGSQLDSWVASSAPVRTAVAAASAPAPAAVGAQVSASASASASAPAPATAPAAHLPSGQQEENRFRMVEDGRLRSADEFDAWMRERQDRYDAYQRQYGGSAAGAPAAVAAPPPAAIATPAASSPVPAAAPVAAAAAGSRAVLQVGVFSVRANAEGALARLRAAGIAAASLQDGMSGGRQVWRVRVGPVAGDAVAELSSRVAGLGFGQPHVVRE